MSSTPALDAQDPKPLQQAESSIMGKILAVPALWVAFSAAVGIGGAPFVSEPIDLYMLKNHVPHDVLDGVNNRNIRVYNNDNPLSYVHGAWIQAVREYQVRRNTDETVLSALGSSATNYLTFKLPMAWTKAISLKGEEEMHGASLISGIGGGNGSAYLFPPRDAGTRSYLSRVTGIPEKFIDKKFSNNVDECQTKFQWGHELKHADQFPTDIDMYSLTLENLNRWESEADQHGLDVTKECDNLRREVEAKRDIVALTMHSDVYRGDYIHLSSYYLEAKATGATPPSAEEIKKAHDIFMQIMEGAGVYATDDRSTYWRSGYDAAYTALQEKQDNPLITKMLERYVSAVGYVVDPSALPKTQGMKNVVSLEPS